MMEYSNKGIGDNFGMSSQKTQELEAAIALQEQKMGDLRSTILQSTSNYTSDDISVSDRNGKIYASHDALILMPLYQEQGEDGFFLIRSLMDQ